MALALSEDFEALCGFAPLPDIITAVDQHPELKQVIGDENLKALADSLHGSSEQQKQVCKVEVTRRAGSYNKGVASVDSRQMSGKAQCPFVYQLLF
jgi:hypothetical protein